MRPLPLGNGHRARVRLAGLAAGPARQARPETWAIGVVVAVATITLLGPIVTLVLAAASGAARLGWQVRARQAQRRLRQAQLPEALERMGAALRSGSSLVQAVTAAGATQPPLGPELAAVARDADRGRPLLDVLDTWADRHGDRATRLAATALSLAARVGAAPAQAVDGVAATLREHGELARERHALATQARASAAVLSLAPVGFAALLGTTDRAAARFLLGSGAGWLCLGAGIGLDVLGAWWMSRLIRNEGTGTP
jgi:tight adherence protein B